MACYLGFDPGRDKCGVAVVDSGKLQFRAVIPSDEVPGELERLRRLYPLKALILGNQTTSRQWQERLAALAPGLPIYPVDERNSTQEAKEKYWRFYPPKGLTRLLPAGLRTPPRPVDDIVALVLIERFLAQNPGA
jgi:RNase H-fold protein (predicted Holliday junction resolvase)